MFDLSHLIAKIIIIIIIIMKRRKELMYTQKKKTKEKFSINMFYPLGE
jgi:hypothetical protein